MASVVGLSFYGFRRRRKRLLMVSVVVFVVWFPSWKDNYLLWFPSPGFRWILPSQEDSNFRTYRVIPVFVGVFRTGFRRGRKTLFDGFRRWLFDGFRRGKECFVMVSLVGVVYGFRLLQDRGSLSDGNNQTKNKQRDVSVTN